MHFDFNKPRPSDELVDQVGPVLATHLVEKKVKSALPELAAAQSFQENHVARLNEKGARGVDGVGQCVARIDGALFLKIYAKHQMEIAADPRKFWLVTCPRLYPHLGIKPKYVPKAGISLAGVQRPHRFKF